MYQQRRTAPAVSAYESQAARWKQGFTATGQPGHPQQLGGGGARHSDLEVVLIGELCSSIGSSSFPPRDVLQKLVRHLPGLDHIYVCELLDDKLMHRLWQVQGKALSVLDAILKTAHAEPYKQHYHARMALLHELATSRKDIVKNRAEKVLAVIRAYTPPAASALHETQQQHHEMHMYHDTTSQYQDEHQHNAYYEQQQQQQQQQQSYQPQQPREIDLLQGFDEPDDHDDVDATAAAAPDAAAQSAFGFISAAPAPPIVVASAPPPTASGFGFLNTPAPTLPTADATAAPVAHLSSTSPPPHDRPLRVEDLSTSMYQRPVALPYPSVAPAASAFAFIAGAATPVVPHATAAPAAAPSRPVDVWDALPAPTPTIGGVQLTPETPAASTVVIDEEEETKVHDPIHDAFEGLDAASDASDLDALDHTHVSLATPYPSAVSREPVVQTREPLREVVLDIELPPGPMGLVLDRTIADMAVIERFIPLPNGERGYLEMHPAICPGCALLSINSVSVEHKGLDDVGPTLAAFAQVPKLLRFKKLMNNGRTANPSTLLMPYVPPPPEEDEATKRERSEHMTRLTEFSTALDDVESKLDDLVRRVQLHLPVVDKKNQLAQLHGHVETIQTQGIDAVILGPNPPPNFDEVKTFRSALVRRADALAKRIQQAAEPPVDLPAPASDAVASPVSGFAFVSNAPVASLTLPPVAANDEPATSSFHFLNPSTPPVQAPGTTSSFCFMDEHAQPTSSFAFLQPAPPTTQTIGTSSDNVAPVTSVFAGLSVKDDAAASVHAASVVSAGPLTLSALGEAASLSSVSTLTASGPSRYMAPPAPTPASSFAATNTGASLSTATSSAFGFLSALDDLNASAAPTAAASSSPTAFGFLRSGSNGGNGDSSSSTSSSLSSSATSEPPAATSASAFAFISS